MTMPLALGAILAAAALAFVLSPLVRGRGDVPRPTGSRPATSAQDGDEDPVVALRDAEFDRETGKLTDADYGVLRARYTAQALARIRAAG